MIARAFTGGPLATIAYLVYDREGGSGAIIDAPLGTTKRLLEAIAMFKVDVLYLFSTHGHWDHIADNVALVESTGAKLCAHVWDMTRMANPQIASEDDFSVPVKPSRADIQVRDGEILEIGDLRLEVLHTPGHTPGSICLYEAAAGALFTGDTLYKMGVGRTDFPGGNADQLNKSLARLAALPDKTRVYPGHGPPTTIKNERWLLELAVMG